MATLKNGLSRRSFLTLGGVAALGGAAALAGCAPQASSSANADAKGATDNAASAMQIADQTKECDIAIVGAGGAGMWAAVEAVRAGKSVVVIEKGGNVGVANGSLAGGPFMVGSKLQQEAGVEFTVEEAFNHIMEYAHWSTNAAAVKAAVVISGETVDQFTDDFGVPTGLRPDNYGAGHASVRANFQSDPKDSKTQAKGEDRMKPLQEFVESKGGEFLFNTAGKRLIMEDGACTGVQCEGDGVTDVKAKAVIVATGGFLGNVDMMREKFGTFVNPLGNVLSVGEGIDMVQEKGRLGETYNIGGHNEKQNIQIIEIIIDTLQEMLPADDPRRKLVSKDLITYVADRKGHDRRYAIAPDKIKAEVGWEPETKFEDGIRKTIAWFFEHEDWMKNVTSGDYQKYYEDMYQNR